MHEANGTFAAEPADEVDAAELAQHRVWITLVFVDAASPGGVQLVAGWTRAAVATRNVLTASHWLARTCLLDALVYVFIGHTTARHSTSSSSSSSSSSWTFIQCLRRKRKNE